MNTERLKAAEAAFLSRYPQGFDDPGLETVRKRHNVGRLAEFAAEKLERSRFSRPDEVLKTVERIVSRSSMVSRFEKPRFREFVTALSGHEKDFFVQSLAQRLFGPDQEAGFAAVVSMLTGYGAAKWPVVSAVPFYFAPTSEAFVKPTTAKRVIAFLEVEGLKYTTRPDWQFYTGYRSVLDEVRERVAPSLGGNYAALSGFLMSTVP
jgi:hypothetical protein